MRGILRLLAPTVAIGFGSIAIGDTTYVITDLGKLGSPAFNVNANGINSGGWVVGQSWLDSTHAHGYLWRASFGMQDLGALGTGRSSEARAINDNGLIVGDSRIQVEASPTHAFKWTQGTGIADLGTIGGDQSAANGVNNAGDIVGWSTLNPGSSRKNAVMWKSGGGNVNLQTLGGMESYAMGINELGQVVGQASDAADVPRPFLWDEVNGMVDLTNPGDGGGYANAVNETGHVVGSSKFGFSGSTIHAFYWKPIGGMHDLGTFGGAESYTGGINDFDQVVGYALDASDVPKAFIWDPVNGMIDLNTRINPGSNGWVLEGAGGINNNGQICGVGRFGGQVRAFLATPVPEPATVAVLGLAVAASVRRRKFSR